MVDAFHGDGFHDVAGDLPSYTRQFPGEEPNRSAQENEGDVIETVAADVENLQEKITRLKTGETAAGDAEKLQRRLERKALHLVLDDLREKGVSDQFLEENMFTIKERVHHFLYE